MNFILVGGGAPKRPPTAGDATSQAAAAKPRPVDLARLKRVSLPQEARPTDNRRAASRKAARLAGDIFIDSSHWLSCTVRDMSATGAMLEVLPDRILNRSRGALPDRFYLVIESALERSMVECLVRWRKGERAGVQFMGPMTSAARVVPPRPVRRAMAAGGRR